jgi:hypothetical protein
MTYIRIRYQKRGGHYHCRLFTAQNYDGTFANCGELVFDEREWAEVRDKLSRCEWIDDFSNDIQQHPSRLGDSREGA